MKVKQWGALLAAFLMIAPICIRASATQTATTGIYAVSDTDTICSIKTASGETVSPVVEQGTGTIYPDAGQFAVACSGTMSGKDYAIFVVQGSEKPSDENTVYVNQKTASGSTLVFNNIVPKSLTAGQYCIYVTGGGRVLNTAQPLATFSYREAAYTLTVTLTSAKTNDMVKLRLWKDGEEVTLTNNTSADANAVFQCSGLTAGNYVVTAEKNHYVTHAENITITGNQSLQIALYKRGDIDGNGSALNENYGILDMQCLYTYLSENRNMGQITDEACFKRVADVNGDGSVNILDYQCLYEWVLESAKAVDYSQYGTDTSALSDLSADNIFKVDAALSSNKTRVDLTLTLTGAVKLCGFDMTLHYNKDVFTLSELNTEKELSIVADRQDSQGTVSFNYGNAKNITKEKTILTASFTVAEAWNGTEVFWLEPEEIIMVDTHGLDTAAAPYLLTYQKIGTSS